MSTPPPEFGKPPAFGGASVRIQPFWTTQIMDNLEFWNISVQQLTCATSILRAHTLGLQYDLNGYNYILSFNDKIYPEQHGQTSQNFRALRNLIPKDLVPENRLIVIFAQLHYASGICVREAEWLPFVIVDPRPYEGTQLTLIHEIGHASRAAHVEKSVMEQAGGGSYRNFCNLHAHEIYKSYWCTGPPPTSWWVRGSNFPGSPYLWPPFDRPS